MTAPRGTLRRRRLVDVTPPWTHRDRIQLDSEPFEMLDDRQVVASAVVSGDAGGVELRKVTLRLSLRRPFP